MTSGRNRAEPAARPGQIDLLIVLRDPLEPHPHDPDVKALLRVAVVCSISLACNRATADLVIPSPLCLKLAAGFSALQAGVLRDRDS